MRCTRTLGLGLLCAPVVGALVLGLPGVGTRALATTAPGVERHATVVFAARGLTVSPRRLQGANGATVIVVFKIRNTTVAGRRLLVGTYRSPIVPPGRVRNYSVAFAITGALRCRSVPEQGMGKVFSRILTIAR